MPTIKHILFPIDFSDRSSSTVPFVEAVANRYSAKITLLSVEQPIYFTGMADPTGALMVDPQVLLQDLKTRLDSAFTTVFSGLRVERFAELGEPAKAITDFAKTHAVDLIMMPTHGYGPFRSMLLGSVTAKVLHDAECPVWTTAHSADEPGGEHLACRSILCAIETTAGSEAVIQWAAELAKDTGATLRLLHVITGMQDPIAKSLNHEFERDLAKEAREKIDEMQRSLGLSVPLCVTVGEVAVVVAEEATRHNADAVVIGRGAIQETLGRLRAHDYAIIRRSPCPVYSV